MSANYDRFSPTDKLATARFAARQRFPYFTTALLSLIPKDAPDLGTVAVTADFQLLVDWKAFATWPLDEAVASLVHEVSHVLRDHHARCKAMGADPKLWNKAADAEINDDLVAAFPAVVVPPSQCPHGRGFILPSMFGQPDGLTSEAYYRELRQQEEAGKDRDDGTEKEDKPGAGRGWCGSGAGRPVPGEPEKGQAGEEGSGGRSEAEVNRIRKAVANAMRDAEAKGRGSVPEGWLRWAESVVTPPKVRWQDKLARAARTSIAFRKGAVDSTFNRPSRRQGGLGYGMGKPLMPALHAPIPDVDIWVDTSGSMGTAELTIALREARGVLLQAGARVRFGACDSEVHGLKEVKNWQELPKLLLGGGGTSFRPIFEAVEKSKRKPSVVIVITDGDGDAPAEEPAGVKTIWLLTGRHAHVPCSWGTVIMVDS